jgi:2OG-Fe(II) oxygenase superfamily
MIPQTKAPEFTRDPTQPVLPIGTSAGFWLDAAEARRIGEELSGEYCFAEPFPHIVLDNFLPEPVIRAALANFPAERLAGDRVFDIGYAGHHKRQISPEDCNATARELFHFFNSAPFLQFLEGLSAIQGLIADPYFHGGGFHETGRGGFLGVHADFRINEKLHLHRRMNVIVYLNEHWLDEYGGKLELWDRDMKSLRASVLPILNRCVIFNTDADSFHGHPDPLTCPENMFRRSIALYYYTASREIYNEVPSNDTIYRARPDDDAGRHREARRLRLDQQLHQWVPPALQRYVFALKRRLGG